MNTPAPIALAFLLSSAALFAADDPVSLFDGKSLDGWKGDRSVWRVEDGAITAGDGNQKIRRNHFLHHERNLENFVLRLEFKLTGDPETGMINSGVQFRSRPIEGGHMSGYQADLGDPKWWGSLYDEHRRNRLLARSDMAEVEDVLKRDDWNEYVIECRGDRIRLSINGLETVDYTEPDDSIPHDGHVAVQIHSGGAAVVQFRDIAVKELPPTAGSPKWAAASEAKSDPNIVFILADDLGYGDLGCYGAPDVETPHIDRLAAEGMRFTDFYANAPVCSPTRIAFLTGRYQQRFGMDNALYYQEMGRGLPADGLTIANRLRAAGYATGLSGKWHVGYDRVRRPPQQGFDHFFGLLGGNHHYFEHMDRIGVPDLWLGNEAVTREGYTTDLVTEDAMAFLERNRDRPFFLFVSHLAPHFPYQGPGDADKRVEPKTKAWQRGDRATAVAMIERMDRGIGALLDRLRALDLEERTLVVFTSDNGGHSHARNAPLRGKKTTLREGGIRVPCIARWPGAIPAGSVTGQVGITMDWTATFAALAGGEAESDRDEGIDLVPVLRGDPDPVERTLFWRQRPGPTRKSVPRVRAVRHGKWKLHQPVREDPALFDLENDIGEETDVAAAHPEVVDDLLDRHRAWEERVDANGKSSQPPEADGRGEP